MRLPGGTDVNIEEKHYLTNAYVSLFGLKTIPFENATDNGYYHLYGKNYRISGDTYQLFLFIFKIAIHLF